MKLGQRDSRFTENRLAILQWGLVAVFLVLLSGFWRLQIFRPAYYSRLADRNHIKSLSIPAPRGRILDRHNRVLVDNYPSFSIIAQREVRRSLQAHLSAIAEGLGLDLEQLGRHVKTSQEESPYRPIVVREDATRQQIAFVESHRVEFPELDLMSVQRRLYPQGGFAAHLLGYVGEVSGKDLELPEMASMQPGDLIGKSGIERQYDDVLRGEDGVRRVIVNSRGMEMAVLDQQLPTAGRDLRLTLDYDLQEIAERRFPGDKGAVVALDPRTGEILVLLSRPAFNSNLFTMGIPQPEWNRLLTDPDNPLLNRAIQAQLAPGSVYKILLATASLEAGTADETTRYSCRGGAVFYGRYFKCWKRGGHGRVNIHRAIVQSCDVFFYNLGKNLGVERMAYYSTQFGLGRKTGIDLPNEESGTMPSPEWKQRRFRQKWYAGETISLAIGQGALTVTPLQVAYSIGGIASGGTFAKPRLVSTHDLSALGQEIPSPSEVRVPLSEQTVTLVTDGLYGVVNEGGGTGRRARIRGLDVGGKTGSAQVASIQTVRDADDPDALKDNAWFVGLAPRRNPEIVVAVLYEGGEHGYLAAPIVRSIIKAYFDKKKKIAPHYAGKPEPKKAVAAALPAPGGEG